MKKLLFCLAAVLLLAIPASLEAQSNEPHYFFHASAGAVVTEWAANGTNREGLEIAEHFVQNGRLYFVGAALPMSEGNLVPGFEFDLDWHYHRSPRITAVYRGPPRGPPPCGRLLTEPFLNPAVRNIGLYVAGYAVRGSITITHVFFSDEEERQFSNSVRMSTF